MSEAKKLLVVDDDKSNLTILKNLFKAEYEVITAENGISAQEVLKDYIPDIILSDINMPQLNGYELAKWIKKQSHLKSCKLLLISGFGETENRIAGYEAGADDYIIKPFKTQELIAKVNVFYKLKKTEDELRYLNQDLSNQVNVRTDQLIQSEKLAAIGRNTAGFIHNLNNPLCAIAGIVSLLEDKYPEEKCVKVLNDASNKMQDIVKQILKAARSKNTVKLTKLNIEMILETEINLSKSNALSQDVEYKLNLNSIPSMMGTGSDFSQLFGNLIDNALQAMYKLENKTLTISSKTIEDEILIEIEDNGCGIPKENLSKIFDPFFTTKPSVSKSGEPTGTGLGMPTCKTMVESYGGKMIIDSTVNKGTIVRLYLPIG